MTIRIADSNDLKLFMQIRLETLREVNTLPPGYIFSDEILKYSEEYFTNGNHTTVLAFNECVYKSGIPQTGNCHADDENIDR
ncbi:MAG: hypothetical protein K2K46_00670 [Lachnospiraceae bacterium]|nr:hypothetical protein [Lachnospiraceae bacterium]